MKPPLPGMPRDLTAHKHHAAHDLFYPATCGLLQIYCLGDHLVLADHLEHVVHQHTKEQEIAVHTKLPGRQPFHVHLGLELGMVLLARFAIPLDLQNLHFRQIKGCPDHEDCDVRSEEHLAAFAPGFRDLENEPDRRLNSLDRSLDAASVDGMSLVLLLRVQPVLFALPPKVVLDHEVSFVCLDQVIDQLFAVKASVSHHQKRLLGHGPSVVKSLRDELPGPGRTALGTARPEFGVDHPAATQMDKDGIEAELVGVGKLGSFFLGIVVVEDDRLSFCLRISAEGVLLMPMVFWENSSSLYFLT